MPAETGKVDEKAFLLTRWDTIVLEVRKGILKAVFSCTRKERLSFELRIFREDVCIFSASGSTWSAPLNTLKNYVRLLSVLYDALREMAKPFIDFEDALRQLEGEAEPV
jgi:hypothetical protein